MEKTNRKWSARITDGRTIGRKCAFVVGLHNDSVYEDCIASIELNHKEDADGWYEKYSKIAEAMNTNSELQAKAAAYDRLMSGGKKTPKEVANFFGKPIAMDMDGEWRVFYDCIPTIKGCCWTPTEMYEYDVIPSILIDFTGDWKDSLTLPDSWGKTAEALVQYLTKGRQIVVQGELRQERWEKDGQKQSKVRINANNIQLVGGKEEKAEPARQSAPQPASQQMLGPEGYESDEIPF